MLSTIHQPKGGGGGLAFVPPDKPRSQTLGDGVQTV